MVYSRRHSFEDVSSTVNHHHQMPLTPTSPPESSRGNGSLRLTDFATINLPFLEARNTSQTPLSLRPEIKAASISQHISRSKEDRTTDLASSERGHSKQWIPVNAGAAHKAYASPVSPDRFIPKRDFTDDPSTPFRVNKHPQQLSPQEKHLRRRLPGDDPFLPSSRLLPPSPERNPTSTRARQSPHQRPHLVTESTVAAGIGDHDFLRHANSGTVWGVGGTSVARGGSAAADTGGALNPGRPMPAPTYAAKFFPRMPTADEQHKHESRLALALDIDLATRLLGTSSPSTESSPSPTSSDYERLSPYVWKDSAWRKVERDQCKCL